MHQKFKQLIGYRENKKNQKRSEFKDRGSIKASSNLAVSDLELVKSEEEVVSGKRAGSTIEERRASSATHNKRQVRN